MCEATLISVFPDMATSLCALKTMVLLRSTATTLDVELPAGIVPGVAGISGIHQCACNQVQFVHFPTLSVALVRVMDLEPDHPKGTQGDPNSNAIQVGSAFYRYSKHLDRILPWLCKGRGYRDT
jgi:hypothetical protein